MQTEQNNKDTSPRMRMPNKLQNYSLKNGKSGYKVHYPGIRF